MGRCPMFLNMFTYYNNVFIIIAKIIITNNLATLDRLRAKWDQKWLILDSFWVGFGFDLVRVQEAFNANPSPLETPLVSMA